MHERLHPVLFVFDRIVEGCDWTDVEPFVREHFTYRNWCDMTAILEFKLMATPPDVDRVMAMFNHVDEFTRGMEARREH